MQVPTGYSASSPPVFSVQFENGELFTFSDQGSPILIHPDGTCDFKSGEMLYWMWHCAQGVQFRADQAAAAQLQYYVQHLQAENSALREWIELQQEAISDAHLQFARAKRVCERQIAKLQKEVASLRAKNRALAESLDRFHRVNWLSLESNSGRERQTREQGDQ